jgi:PAS domain S-box-containing protein
MTAHRSAGQREAPRRLEVDRVTVLESFVDACDDGLFSYSGDGLVTSWNRSAERIFGYPAREIVGRPTTGLFPEPLRQDAELVFAGALDGASVRHFEVEMVRKDGMPIQVSLSLRPVSVPDDAPPHCVAVARDVTEQRLTQAALAEMEARVRESEALSHVGTWGWDLRTGAVQWSDELHRIHDVDPLEFAGTLEAHIDVMSADDRERVRQGMLGAVRSLRAFEDEYCVVTNDGAVRSIYARAEPMIDSAGSVVGLRGIARDVSDRRTT